MPRDRVARACVVLAGAVLLVWLPSLGWRAFERVQRASAAAVRAFTEAPALRILRTSGISAGLVDAIRAGLPEDGVLVLYSPYGGEQFVLDAADPRGEWARQLRGLWGRLKNLVYPRPRDVRAAYDAAGLRAMLTPELAGRTLVLDGTQDGAPLTIGGRHDLVRDERLGDVRMRLWSFVEAR